MFAYIQIKLNDCSKPPEFVLLNIIEHVCERITDMPNVCPNSNCRPKTLLFDEMKRSGINS